MDNLAGVNEDLADDKVYFELKTAGISEIFPTTRSGEARACYKGHHNGWIFTRLWYYWSAKTDENPLLYRFSDELNNTHRSIIRVNGCAGGQDIKKESWSIGVNRYHIDTQEGLNEFVRYLNIQKQHTSSVCL